MFHLATARLLFFVLDNQRVEADTECVIANHQIVCQPQPSAAKWSEEKKEKKGAQEESHSKIILQLYKREQYMCNCSNKQGDPAGQGMKGFSTVPLLIYQSYSSIIRAPTGRQKGSQDSDCARKTCELRLRSDTTEDWIRISSCFSAHGNPSQCLVPHLLQMVLYQTQLSCQMHWTTSLPVLRQQALPAGWGGDPRGTPCRSLWLKATKKPNFLQSIIVHLVPPHFCEMFYCISVVKWWHFWV